MKAQNYDVVIIGAGIAGLLLQLKLLEMGCRVLLIERNPELARGPSTRCEGILHRGIYHAYAIPDIAEAIEVARKCKYGYEQIFARYPQVVDEYFRETVALVKDEESASRASDRWDKAGVHYESIGFEHAQKILPELMISAEYHFFKAMERSINTRLLLHFIENQIRTLYKGKILTGVKDIRFTGERSFTAILSNGEYELVEGSFIVYAAGKGVKPLFEREFKIDLPVRLFKAHLLVTDRLCRNNVYCLDENEVTIFHHNDKTIIGMTKYNKECKPDDTVIEQEAVDNLIDKTKKYIPTIQDNLLEPYCCQKVDFGSNGKFHSLDTQLHEPMNNHFIALPGKLTEAPWICDQLVKEIFIRMNRSPIALRPCDHIQNH